MIQTQLIKGCRRGSITLPFRIASATLSDVGRTLGVLFSNFSRSNKNALGIHLASKFATKAEFDLNLRGEGEVLRSKISVVD